MPYVIGNSRQVLQFSDSFRAFLDGRPDVFVVNHFPTNWRLAGFRPGVWVWGDTYNDAEVEACRQALRAIRSPELAHVRCFVSVTSERVRVPDQLAGILGVTFYRRHDWLDRDQRVARSLGETIFHFGSTLTDACNLAAILHPGEPIYLFACPYRSVQGHFYDVPGPAKEYQASYDEQWRGFAMLRDFGVLLVNCNTEGETYPEFPAGPSGFLRRGVACKS